VPFVAKSVDEENNILDERLSGNMDTFIQEFIWLAEAINKQKENAMQA